MHVLRRLILVPLALAIFSASAVAAKGEHYIGPAGFFGEIKGPGITVTKVEKGSPADGALKPKDVIVGAGGVPFKENARREIAEAINAAETEEAKGILALSLKDGRTVELRLAVLGSFSETAPYDCPKTDAIITRAADWLVKSGSSANGQICVGWLGLMATGEKKYIDVVRQNLPKQKWYTPPTQADIDALLAGDKDMGYVGWYWGYQCIVLGEYYLLTGDETALVPLRAYAVALAKGQDAGGLWGHRMATTKRNGRLPGYAQINQPSLTCFMGMQMAKKCGIEDPDLERGIATTLAFYSSFIGRGALNYGVHGPNTRLFNNNGTCGSNALNMALAGNSEGASFFSQLCATSYDELETGHATHYFNILWTPLGANLSGPEVARQFFAKSSWLHTLARSWDGHFTFDGGESKSCNSTGSHLLHYCAHRRALLITGRDADEEIWLKGQDATDAIELSKIDYAALTGDELLELFDHPIPQVTRRAGWTMREKGEAFLPKIDELIKDGSPTEKQTAIGFFGWQCPEEWAAPRTDLFGAILKDTDEDPWVRASALATLAYRGEPGQTYYMDGVRFLAEDRPDDVFGDIDWSVGGSLNRLCPEPFGAGLVTDKDVFYAAALKLANNKRQHVRADGLRMLAGMPIEDFYRVGETVMHIIRDEDPTYHSYHSPGGPVTAGITILANLGIKEGIDLALGIEKIPSGKHSFKLKATWASLATYGPNARAALEVLKERYEGRTDFGRHTGAYNAMVKAIEADKEPKKLITFEEAMRMGREAGR